MTDVIREDTVLVIIGMLLQCYCDDAAVRSE